MADQTAPPVDEEAQKPPPSPAYLRALRRRGASPPSRLGALDSEEKRQRQTVAEGEKRRVATRSFMDQAASVAANRYGIRRDREIEHEKGWQKVLNLLQTGNYASAGFAMALIDGDPDVWGAIRKSVRNRFEYTQLLESQGVHGTEAAVLGLVGNIALDPLTYLPFGVIPTFAKTQKGLAVARFLPKLIEETKAAGITEKAAQTELMYGLAAKMKPSERKIIEEAIRDGEKAFKAKGLKQEIELGLRAPYVFELPTGFRVGKIPIGGKAYIPVPIPTAKVVGGFTPPGSAKAAEILESVGKAMKPGFVRVLGPVGKLVNIKPRPGGIPPPVWENYVGVRKRMDALMASKGEAVIQELERLADAGGGADKMMENLGIDRKGAIGRLTEAVFQDAIDRKLGRLPRRVLTNILSDPARALYGPNRNLARAIVEDVVNVKLLKGDFNQATKLGDPEAIGRALGVADRQQLLTMEEEMVRAIELDRAALREYQAGKAANPQDQAMIEGQLAKLEDGIRRVRARIDETPPPGGGGAGGAPTSPTRPPTSPGAGPAAALEVGAPPQPPRVRPIPKLLASVADDTPTPAGRTVQDARAERQSLQDQHLKLYRQSRRLQELRPKQVTPEAVAGLQKRLASTIERMNQVADRVGQVDQEIQEAASAVEQAAQGAKVAGEAQKAAEAEMQAVRTSPALKKPAADVLPEAKQELQAVRETMEAARAGGDAATADAIAEQLQTLSRESLADRAARVGRNTQEERALLDTYSGPGRAAIRAEMEAQDAAERLKGIQEGLKAAGEDPVARVAAATAQTPEALRAMAKGRLYSEFLADIEPQVSKSLTAAAEAPDVQKVIREVAQDPEALYLSLGGRVRTTLAQRENLAKYGMRPLEVAEEGYRLLDAHIAEIKAQAGVQNWDVQPISVHVVGAHAEGTAGYQDLVRTVALVTGPGDERLLAQRIAEYQDIRFPGQPGEPILGTMAVLRPAVGQTQADIVRAFGGMPAKAPKPYRPPAGVEAPKEAAEAATTEATAALEAVAGAAPTSAAGQALTVAQSAAEEAQNAAAVLRSQEGVLHSRVMEPYRDILKAKVKAGRDALRDWHANHGETATNAQIATYQRLLNEQIRVAPRPISVNEPGPKAALAERQGKPRARKSKEPVGSTTPLKKDGDPTVHSTAWDDASKELATVNRDNVVAMIEKHRDKFKEGWRAFDGDGRELGTKTTDEILEVLKSAETRPALVAKKEGGYARAPRIDQVKFFPETHEVGIGGAKGEVILGKADVVIDPGLLPTRAAFNTAETITARVPMDVGFETMALEGSDAVRDVVLKDRIFKGFVEMYGPTVRWMKAQEKGLVEESAAAYEAALAATQKYTAWGQPDPKRLKSAMNEILDVYEFTIQGAKKAKRLHLKAEDLGFDFGVGPAVDPFKALKPRVAPVGEFVTGDNGLPAVVIAEKGANRTIQYADGTKTVIRAKDLVVSDLRSAADADESVLDTLKRLAQRADGSIDEIKLNESMRTAGEDPEIRREMASEAADYLIRVNDKLADVRQGLTDILDRAFVDDNVRGLVENYLTFYEPRQATWRKSMSWLFGPKGLQIRKLPYMRPRTLQYHFDEIARATEISGYPKMFEDDAIFSTGVRAIASVKTTGTYDTVQEVLGKFGQNLRALEGLNLEDIEDGEGAVLALMRHMAKQTGDLNFVEQTEKDIAAARVLMARKRELVGAGYGELVEKGLAAEKLPPLEQAARRKEIVAIERNLQELVPDWGVYIPKGGLRKLANLVTDEPVNAEFLKEGLSPEEIRSILALQRDVINEEGSILVKIDLGNVGALRKLSKHMDGFILPTAIAEDLNRSMRSWWNIGEDLWPFLHMFHGLQGWWKSWTLAVWPVYHLRNEVGNIWNAAILAGANDVTDWVNADTILRGKDVSITDYWGKKFTAKQMEEAAIAAGALERGETVAEHSMTLGKRLGPPPKLAEKVAEKFGEKAGAAVEIGTGLLHPGRKNALLKLGFRYGRRVENRARLALYIDGLRKGYTSENAARRVMKYLFDYRDLSGFEANVLRGIAFPFYTWCVPDDCEALTAEGWKKVDELRIGEMMLSMNHETGVSEWVPCEGKATFPYNGQLLTISNRRDEFAFTPDHRWPTIDHEDRREIRRGYELRSNLRVPRACPFDWAGQDGSVTAREAAIAGWIVTDGYHRWRGGHYEAMVYQSPGKHLDAILDLVGPDGHPGKPHPDTGVVAVQITSETRKRMSGLVPNKGSFVSFVCHLNREAAEACYQAMVDAEGTTTESWTFFAQKHGPVLDAFQILCSLTGRVAHIGARGCYVSRQGSVMKLAEGLGSTWFSGRVWCPVTKHGTWLMRRHGRVIWTGNTRKNVPLQLQHLLTRPAKFTGVEKARQAVQYAVGGDPPDETLLPDWMRNNWPIRVHEYAPGQYSYFLLGSWLPAADIGRLFDPAAMATGMLTPIFKAPFEWGVNYSLYFRDQVEHYPRETGDFIGMRLRKRAINAMRNLRGVNEFDRMAFRKDLPTLERVAREFWGRFYPLDVERAKDFKRWDLQKEHQVLKGAVTRERKDLEKAQGTARDMLLRNIEILEREQKRIDEELERLGGPPEQTPAERRQSAREKRIRALGGP